MKVPMHIRNLVAGFYHYPPETGSGTADNSAGSVTEGQTAPTSSGNVTSGTASEAMIKAAEAASSAEAAPAEKITGDTAKPDGQTPVAKPDATGQPDSTVTRGEAPEPRIAAAVKNAREAASKEVHEKYGLAPNTDPRDVQVGMGLLTDIRADTKGFLLQLASEMGAKVVFEGDTPAKEEVLTYPEPSLVSQDGAKAYSSDDILKILDIQKKQIMGELRPDLEYVRNSKTSAQEAESRRQVAEYTSQQLAAARKLPHFTTENEPKILAKLQAIPQDVRRSVGPIAALHMAYNTFLQDDIFPTIDTAAEARVRESYAKKANAGRGQAHPTDQSGDTKPPKLDNVSDLEKHMEQLAAAATT